MLSFQNFQTAQYSYFPRAAGKIRILTCLEVKTYRLQGSIHIAPLRRGGQVRFCSEIKTKLLLLIGVEISCIGIDFLCKSMHFAPLNGGQVTSYFENKTKLLPLIGVKILCKVFIFLCISVNSAPLRGGQMMSCFEIKTNLVPLIGIKI